MAVVVVPESRMTTCPSCTIAAAASAIRIFSRRWSFSFSLTVGSNKAPSREGSAPPCVRCNNPCACRISRSLRIVTCEVLNCRARSPTNTRPSRLSESKMARLRSSLSKTVLLIGFLCISFYNVLFRLYRERRSVRKSDGEPSNGRSSIMPGGQKALCTGTETVYGGGRGYIKAPKIGPAPGQIRGLLRHCDGAEMNALWRPYPNSFWAGNEKIPALIDLDAIRYAVAFSSWLFAED